MALRSIKGTHLSLGAVIVPVSVQSIFTEPKEAKIDRATKDGHKIVRKEFDAVTDEEVTADDIVRGTFVGDEFHPIDPEALEAINAECDLDTIDVEHFVKLAEVPFDRAQRTYVLAPQADIAAGPLATIHAAMRKSKAAAVVRLTLKSPGPVHLGILHADRGDLLLTLLAYVEHCRRHEAVPLTDAKVKPENVALVQTLIATMLVPGDIIDAYHDESAAKKATLISEAITGKPVKAKGKKWIEPVTTDALLAALHRSVEHAERTVPPGRKTRKPQPVS